MTNKTEVFEDVDKDVHGKTLQVVERDGLVERHGGGVVHNVTTTGART